MLIDLLDTNSYIQINREAIKRFGVNPALYCAEILNINKKVINKNAWVNEKYFKVDRDYITKQTTLSIDEQLQCDLSLSKVNIIKIDPNNPDVICFNIETYASILASEDIQILEAVSKKVKVENPRTVKQTKQDRVIIALKNAVEASDPDVLFALKSWIDSLFEVNKGLSKAQVQLFNKNLNEYCKKNKTDKKATLKIIEIATTHNWIDCDWAINAYEKDILGIDKKSQNSFIPANTQRITTAVGNKIF